MYHKKRRPFQYLIRLLPLFAAVLLVTSCAKQGVTSIEQDGTFPVWITMEGGTGKAYIESPAMVTVTDGNIRAKLVWSSKNYDYMIVDGVRYENEAPGDQSVFTVPVASLTEPLHVTADTVAMSKPHEIEYTIFFHRTEDEIQETDLRDVETESTGVETENLTFLGDEPDETLDLKYATQFCVRQYGVYTLISILNSGDYLLIPEGATLPQDIPETVTVLQQPLDTTYMVTSSGMDLVCRCNALSHIRLSALTEQEWSIPEAAEAMRQGKILYAGKYKAPDYERILQEGCDLAIENTMIYHNPEVREKLQELGIPVLVETSSYEKHPLGRLEWIRLYGILFGEREAADAYYEEQLQAIGPVLEQPDTGRSVAFFHVTTNGMINVRKSGDYISRMIELAGGHYILSKDGEDDENALSTMNMQMEDFYAVAKDADIIIYNSTIQGELSSVDELIAKNELFADFKAVKDGQVYCTERDLFQQTSGMSDFMQDLHAVFSGSERNCRYLFPLKANE
ncbi:MAG: ABC transporter substrate-binding protein [Lachnospiraceae bacterium]|nr:ABC transporter substrate-binding protein [Lachnospiraceae bacterium]